MCIYIFPSTFRTSQESVLDITSVLSVVSELMLRILFSTAVLVLFSETLLTAAHPVVPAKSLKSIEHVWEGAARAAAVVRTALEIAVACGSRASLQTGCD